jgi:hypothetical protein
MLHTSPHREEECQVDSEKTPRERAEDLISLLVSDWRPTAPQVLWGIRIVLAFVIVVGVLTLVGRPFGITLWQWLDLLIIPAVLAIGGYLFARSENRATQAAAERRAQDEALQAYLDNMSEMLMPSSEQPSLYEEPLPDSLRTVARARTLTVLSRLDGDRKARVVQFLYEAGLIAKGRPIVDLAGGDLRGTNLFGANLREADLRRTYRREADLSSADLSSADLYDANLREANLSSADLSSADLSSAYLFGANLRRAYLSSADLSGATGITNEKLGQEARSFKGATMPNGQKYEDWLKDKKAQGKDEKNE